MARNLVKFVRRYTTMSSALDTLVNQKLVLLSPSTWDDTNDVDFMELYRAHTNAQSVLALCCTMASETYHHWRIFTQGMEGVCIEFDKHLLEGSLNNFIKGPVEYLLVRDLAALGPEDAHRLPFVKRDGYSDEREWRILHCSEEKAKFTCDVPIPLSSITKIILNPWLPTSLAENIKSIMRSIPGCSRLKIRSSALTNSSQWKAAGKKLLM